MGREAAQDEATEAGAALEAVVLAELAVGSGTADPEIPTAFRSIFAREGEGWFDLFVRDAAASLKRNKDFWHIWTAEQLARIESDTRALLVGLDGLAVAVTRLEDKSERRHRELRDRTEERASYMPWVSAFFFAGRLRVIIRTPAVSSQRIRLSVISMSQSAARTKDPRSACRAGKS